MVKVNVRFRVHIKEVTTDAPVLTKGSVGHSSCMDRIV